MVDPSVQVRFCLWLSARPSLGKGTEELKLLQ